MLRIKVKRNVLLVAAVAFAASCLCGCVDDAVSAVPEVKIEIVEVTPAAVTFTIKSSDALEGAYVVVEDGKDIPSAADVLTEGTAIDVSVPVTDCGRIVAFYEIPCNRCCGRREWAGGF